ncbi:MAG: pantetheine-phosphate adenylyltransferase [Acidobacteriota bacterium]
MKHLAIYPGSFDPPTNGHMDIIRRATGLFETVVVALLKNTEKTSLLSFDERLNLLEECTRDIPGVEVDRFEGLLVDYIRKRGATHVLRGIRALSDFEYEYQMALMNQRLAPEVETVFLMPREEYTFLSSRLVREVSRLGGPVQNFVPDSVAKFLKKKQP